MPCKRLSLQEFQNPPPEGWGEASSTLEECRNKGCCKCTGNEICCDGECCEGISPTAIGCSCGPCGNCPSGYCRTQAFRTPEEPEFCDGQPWKINCRETLEDGIYKATYCDNV